MKRRLSEEAIARIEETIEAEYAAGDSQIASDLQTLLDWYKDEAGISASLQESVRLAR
jgi:hypothetical protein